MKMTKRVEVYLTDEEWAFIKWMAKRDTAEYGHKITVADEMRTIFSTELEHLKDIYLDEMKMEEGK